MAYRITGIRKPGGVSNVHEAISHYRWIKDGQTTSYISDRVTFIGLVEGKVATYVQDSSGNKAYCKINVSKSGTRFLQTYSDGKWTDNLLSLPLV